MFQRCLGKVSRLFCIQKFMFAYESSQLPDKKGFFFMQLVFRRANARLTLLCKAVYLEGDTLRTNTMTNVKGGTRYGLMPELT